jgi:hypothetical protein
MNKTPEQTAEQLAELKIEKSVIELNSKFKNVEKHTFCSAVPLDKDNLYNTFVELIKSWEKLPTSKIIESDFNISKRERLNLYEKLAKNNYLIDKGNGNGFIINPNLDFI